jgi:hypothetical protein
MRHQQQVMCQRFTLSLRTLNQELRMTQEAARSDCRSDSSTCLRPNRQCQVKRLTFHSTAEFGPIPACRLSPKRTRLSQAATAAGAEKPARKGLLVDY